MNRKADYNEIAGYYDRCRTMSEANLDLWLDLVLKYSGAGPGTGEGGASPEEAEKRADKIHRMIRMLNSPSEALREDAQRFLLKTGDEAVPYLEAEIKKSRERMLPLVALLEKILQNRRIESGEESEEEARKRTEKYYREKFETARSHLDSGQPRLKPRSPLLSAPTCWSTMAMHVPRWQRFWAPPAMPREREPPRNVRLACMNGKGLRHLPRWHVAFSVSVSSRLFRLHPNRPLSRFTPRPPKRANA